MSKNLNYPQATYFSNGVQTDVGMLFNAALATPTASSTYVLYMDSSYNLYWWNGTTASKLNNQGGGGGTGSLEDAYGAGRTILLDEGAVVWTDATTGAANSMEFKKTGAGTGNVIDLDMDAGIATGAIYIDNGAGARTASDIKVKDDSTGTHSVIDIDKSGAGASVAFDWTGSYNGSPAGQVFKLTFDANDNLDTEVMQIDTGAGARGIMFDLNFGHTDSGTTSHIFDIDVTGVLDSNVLDITYSSAASTGDAVKVVMGTNVSGAAFFATGTGVRTDSLFELSSDDTGAVALATVAVTGTSSGAVVDFSIDGAITGNVLDIDMNAGVASKAIYIDAGAGTRTVALIDIKHDGDGNVSAINIDQTNTGSGNIIELDIDAVHTGNAIDINYGTSAATGSAINIATGTNLAGNALKITTAGARTAPVINVVGGGTDAGTDDHIILITQSAVLDSNMIQLTYDTAASTGDALGITMGTNVAGSALAISAAGARTDDLIKIDDSSTGSAHIFDINITGVYTGNVLDIAYSASAATGDAIVIAMGTAVAGSALVLTGTGSRTDDLIKIDDDSTGNSQIFDINLTGAYTGNVLDITYSVGAATGDAISVVMGTNLAGSALVITRTGLVTDDTIKIDSDQTGSTHQFDINLTGAGSGNCLDITYSVAANTGNAISLAMGTNVGGQAIVVTSAATGAANEGSLLDISHTGNLVANADGIRIVSTGNHDATSNVMYLEQSTGAGTAGTTLLRLNATGANVEALAIDAGVAFLSTATATPGSGDGETIPCTANVVAYDPNGASRTGVIVQTGLRDGQKLTILNIADAAETVTMAASGTSHVAFGTSCVIARYQAVELTWNAATALWYQNIVA